jgi:hypothetical protein
MTVGGKNDCFFDYFFSVYEVYIEIPVIDEEFCSL